jgi:hypothetical protein
MNVQTENIVKLLSETEKKSAQEKKTSFQLKTTPLRRKQQQPLLLQLLHLQKSRVSAKKELCN